MTTRAGLLVAAIAVVGLSAGPAIASGAPTAQILWGNANGGIGSAKADGTDANQFLPSGSVNDVATNGRYIYWTEQSPGAVMKANLDGSAPSTLVAGLTNPNGIAVTNQYVYWADPSDGKIYRANLDGTGKVTLLSNLHGASGLAVDSQHLYWTSDFGFHDGIGQADIDGSNPERNFIMSFGSITAIAVDGQHVYWGKEGEIWRANIDGSNDGLFLGSLGSVLDIELDSQHLYYAGPSTVGQVGYDGTGHNPSFISMGGSPAFSPAAIALVGAGSANTDLSGLTVAEGTLEPGFNPATDGPYELRVGRAVDTAHLTALLADANATVTVNGVIATSGAPANVPLHAGANDIPVVVTAENGTTATYTVTLYRDAAPPLLFWGVAGRQEIGSAQLPNGLGATSSFVQTAPAGSFVAADSDYLYWSDPPTGRILRSNLDGSTVTVLVSDLGVPGGIAVDDQHIYWADLNSHDIGRANLDGSNPEPNFIADVTTSSFYGMTVDDQHIYWAKHGGIGRAALDGSAVELNFIHSGWEVFDVAVSEQHVYWTHYPNYYGQIGRANLDGTDVNGSFYAPDASSSPAGIAVHGQHLYWASHGASRAIVRMDLDGSNIQPSFIQPPASYALDIAIAPASANAALSDLNAAEGALTPGFDPAATSYQLDVGNDVTSTHLTASVADDDAALTASAGSLSGNTLTLPLDVGANVVNFTVTAQDGLATKTYTVTITRAAAQPTLTVVTSPAKPGSTKPEFTTNRNVQLKTTAPAGTTQVEISNDPGFGDAQSFPVAADGSYAWTLTGDGEHTVYVRFLGAGSQPTLSATVKLDATAPKITKARFVKRGNGRVWVSVAAVDPVSGVARLQFAPKRTRPWVWRTYRGTTSNRTGQSFIWVRTADGAGNISAWKKIVFPAKRSR